MQLCLASEQRFHRTSDGHVWMEAAGAFPFCSRYLEVFDSVQVLARIKDVMTAPPDWHRADSARVSFHAVPYYLGPLQFLRSFTHVRLAIRSAVPMSDAFLLRAPGTISALLFQNLSKDGYPFGVEVVGDPYEVFSPGTLEHPLRPWLRYDSTRRLKRMCEQACAATYVTSHALQRRYPTGGVSFAVSDVELPPAVFVEHPRPVRADCRRVEIVTVASLAQLYKAPDILIAAVAICVRKGLDLRLVLVGDGKYRTQLEALVAKLDVENRITFAGQVNSGELLRTHLDRAALFVLPSRTEGLPRAMIEAMARGLPCIGTPVGGVPELLPPEDLVPAGDAAALAQKIGDVISDPARMARMSKRNLETARRYSHNDLRARQIAFYSYLKRHTESWRVRRCAA